MKVNFKECYERIVLLNGKVLVTKVGGIVTIILRTIRTKEDIVW